MILQRLWPCGGRRPESDPAGGAKNHGPFLITKLWKYWQQTNYIFKNSVISVSHILKMLRKHLFFI